MRFMSHMYMVSAVAVVGLTLGLAACSDKKENAEQAQNASGNSASEASAPSAAQQAAQAPVSTGSVYVPAPLPASEQQKLDEAKAKRASNTTRAEYEIPNEYICKNGTKFKAVFTRNPDSVLITFPGRVTVTLPKKNVSGVGFWYETPQYALRGRGPHAKWIMAGRDAVDCTVSTYAMSQ